MESRNYKSGAAGSAPAAPGSPSNGYPTEGNPATATPATVPGPFWYYAIGEEIRSAISNAGLTPSDADLAQLAKAIQSGQLITAAAGGTADAITATFAPALTSLTLAPSLVLVKASAANTTTTPTFAPNGLTAKTIVKGCNQALVAGDIFGAGHWLLLSYDRTLTKWVLLNPAYGITTTGFMLVQEQQTQGTNGGNSVSNADNLRLLNTVVTNSISGASLASNQITLPAGTYKIDAMTGSYKSVSHKPTLYNVTDAAVQVHGIAGPSVNTEACYQLGSVVGYFTISASKVFELRIWTQTGQTNGLGVAVGRGIEVYSTIEITKIA